MPLPRHDRHPDHVRTSKTAPQGDPLYVNPDSEVSNSQKEYYKCQEVYASMTHFCDLDHGYLKVKRQDGGSQLYLTWTWTITNAAGSYVYVQVNFWELNYGLDMLLRKVLEVDNGSRKPTPDKRNPRH